MKNYEITLILNSELPQEARTKLVQDIASFVQDRGGLLEKQEFTGKSSGSTKGMLALLACSIKQEEIENLSARLKIEKDILRFMISLAPRRLAKIPTLQPASQTPPEKEGVKLAVEDIDKKLEEIFKDGPQ